MTPCYYYVQGEIRGVPNARCSRYWVCRADGEEFHEEGIVNAYGVIGCHSYRPELYDPDEYDHEHDGCGWVTVIRDGR